MSYVRALLKYILFFVFGVLTATFVSATAVSYYAVEHLALPKNPEKPVEKKHSKKSVEEELPPQDTWINSNIIEVLHMGDQYAAELNLYDELKGKVSSQKAPALCEVICNGSSFDKDRMLEERTPYLKNFYVQNGTHALRDPFFQLKLREVGVLAEIFPASLRALWVDVEQKRAPNLTVSQKLSWSLQFEIAALKELYRLSGRWDELKKETERIQGYRELIQSCQKGLRPVKDLRLDCQNL